MDSSAHRHGSDASEAGADPGLSAAERADLRWGLERVLMLHGTGGDGGPSGDLARTLQRALRHLPVVMLDDRRLPDGSLIQHLAVGPGGVTVVGGLGAAELVEPLTVECLRGMFGARAELLLDGACADRTGVIAPLRAQAAAVRTVIDDMAPVVAALCLDGGEDAVARLRPLMVSGVLIGDPKAVAELAARDGDLHDYELAALADLLDGTLPPALTR
jgi:hypothetical protein